MTAGGLFLTTMYFHVSLQFNHIIQLYSVVGIKRVLQYVLLYARALIKSYLYSNTILKINDLLDILGSFGWKMSDV